MKKERSLNERQVVFLCALVLKLGGSATVTHDEFKALDATGPGAVMHFTVHEDESMTAEIIPKKADSTQA